MNSKLIDEDKEMDNQNQNEQSISSYALSWSRATAFNAANVLHFAPQHQKEQPNIISNDESAPINHQFFSNNVNYEETEEGEITDSQAIPDNQRQYQTHQQVHLMTQGVEQHYLVSHNGVEEEFKEEPSVEDATFTNQEPVVHRIFKEKGSKVGGNIGIQASVSMSTQMVSTQTLAPFMKTKRNAYNILANEVNHYLSHIAQYYLPPYDECTLEFIRDLLSAKKKCFKNSQIRMIKVPKLEELTAKKIMEQIQGDESIQMFLPELTTLKRPLNREYLFNVINTLKPGYFETNIPHAFKKRKEDAELKRQQMIEVCSEMLQAIKSSNQRVTSQNGKALGMLRSGIDKKRRREKPQREKFQPLIPLSQVDPVQKYLNAIEFGSPRQYKKAKRTIQAAFDGNNITNENNMLIINQASGGSGAITSQLNLSATTTKSKFTSDGFGSNHSVKQFQPEFGKKGKNAQSSENNFSGISASSSNQPQRRLL